jgi:hypothetical protein
MRAISIYKLTAAQYDVKEQIEKRMDELAREYGRTPRGDPRRSEIFKELSELCRRLIQLLN